MALDANTEELKASRGGATVQKQSMDTQGGLFGGATVQTAGFGSGFRRGGFGGGASLPGGGSGSGYSGEQGLAGSGAGRSFGGGGRFNGLGGTRPSIPPIGPRPDVPKLGSSPSGSDAGNLTALIERKSSAAGIDPSWMEGIRAGESGHRHNRGNPQAAYDHNPGAPGRPEDSWGPFQLNRLRGLGQDFQRETGLDLSDLRTIPAQTRGVARYLRKQFDRKPNYSPFPTWQGFHGRRNASPTWGDSGYVPEGAPRAATAERADGGGTDLLPGDAPRLLRPNSMPGAPGVTMDEANRTRSERADGAGWAAREAARKTFEAQQAEAAGLPAGGARVAATAAHAGVVAMPKVENNGSVVVNVLKPGPETRVATTASGKLFQDVVQRSGAQMRKAD